MSTDLSASCLRLWLQMSFSPNSPAIQLPCGMVCFSTGTLRITAYMSLERPLLCFRTTCFLRLNRESRLGSRLEHRPRFRDREPRWSAPVVA